MGAGPPYDELLARGRALLAERRDAESLECFQRATSIEPEAPAATLGQCHALMRLGRLDSALTLIDRLRVRAPACRGTDGLRAQILLLQGRGDDAWTTAKRGCEDGRNDAAAFFVRGMLLLERGDSTAALAAFDAAIALDPDLAPAHHARGNTLASLGRPDAALQGLACARRLDPCNATIPVRVGHLQIQLNEFAQALDAFEAALALDARNAAALQGRAQCLAVLGRPAEAVASYTQLSDARSAQQERNPDVWFLRGNAQQLGGDHAAAVQSYDEALQLRPDFPAALNNQAHSLRCLRRAGAALIALDRALALQPAYANALNNRGLALLDLQRFAKALRSFDRALELRPDFPEVLSNRGTTLLALKRFAEAAESFERLTALAPGFGGALGNLLYARRNCCDWRDYESLAERIVAKAEQGELADLPLSFLCLCDAPRAQLACARTFVTARYPALPVHPQSSSNHRLRQERVRVAYLSGDFGEHAVSYLLAGVIERHDSARFEISAIAWGRRDDGATRGRLQRAFGRFIDATELSDAEIALRMQELEVDIAIDLTGHTAGQRTGIFAARPAPIQVNYLGYPGTSGAPYMDYIIADAVVVPAGDEAGYSERIARLPHCYLPGDDRRSIAGGPLTRASMGLPAAAFVFCAFNNPLKITPEVFKVWLGLLRDVPEAVLWLRGGAPQVRFNLQQSAEQQGIDPTRLVFAATEPSPALHLARHRLADLFLDTVPYNGHATSSDALWAGLPVLTCRGRSFASRVGASLLGTLGLPELVAASLDDYARTARALARDPARLTILRQRLAGLRDTSPLFATGTYCRHLETAYLAMMERYRHGLPPASFDVPPSA